jgi:hypothetical protein
MVEHSKIAETRVKYPNRLKGGTLEEVKITILNSMAGGDFEKALDQHVSWDIKALDLKDSIFCKGIADLTEDEARQAAKAIAKRDLSVYCLSTGLFHGHVEQGEEKFRRDYFSKIDHVIRLAEILQPQMIRLLSAQTSRRNEIDNSIDYIQSNHRWLIPLYAESIDRIYDSGYRVTIENEVGNCIFAGTQEIIDLFGELGRREKVCFTWDVQNLWQMGTYPTMDVYNRLRDLMGYYHLKGGQKDENTGKLLWRSSLEDASWQVVNITRQVVKDGIAEVICLNPSHGKTKEGYDYTDITKRDLDFVRRMIPEVE